mmetsp:Transcript_5861/g.12858  ORF Transcript_5861/g.12858 Transcript_5861/m.12858 type:complete len:338 (+) Transcript_5861:105-1118(+)
MRSWQLLLASALFSFAGFCWIFVVLAWKYAWLLQFLAFATTALLLFASSAACFAAFVVRMGLHCQDGLLHFMPAPVVALFDHSVFELLHLANRRIVLPLFDWLRLILLVGFELNEEDRRQILNEMNREFREDVFQRPALRVLPVVVQQVLLGRHWQPAPEARNVDSELAPTGDQQFGDALEEVTEDDELTAIEEKVGELSALNESPKRQLRERHNSIDQLQNILRRAEAASRASVDSCIVQKVLTEKLSDQAAYVIKGTATHQYEEWVPLVAGNVSLVCQRVSERIITPPERIVLRVPWEVARINLKVAGVVWNTFFGAREPVESSEEPLADVKKEE